MMKAERETRYQDRKAPNHHHNNHKMKGWDLGERIKCVSIIKKWAGVASEESEPKQRVSFLEEIFAEKK